MKHLKKFAGRIGNFVEETKLKYQRQILRWNVIYSPDEMKRFSALTIISLTALIILVLCVVEETKNVVLHSQTSLFSVDHQNELSSTECNLDYFTMKSREDDDPCVINFIRRFYLFNNNLPATQLTGESSNNVVLANKSPILYHHQRIDSNNELSTTYDERKVSQVVTKFMQSRGKKQRECLDTRILRGMLWNFIIAGSTGSVIEYPTTFFVHYTPRGILGLEWNPDNIDLMRHSRKNVNNEKLAAALSICLNFHDGGKLADSSVAIPSGNYFINEKKRLADSFYNQGTVNLPSTSSSDMMEVGPMDFSNQETFYSLLKLFPKSNVEVKPVQSLDRELVYNVIDDWQQCFTLRSILLASNQSKIDFLSLIDLNVAGGGVNELIFLQNIPWYQIDIKMVALKVSGYPDVVKRAVVEFMESVGFFKYATRNLKAIGEVFFLVKKRPFELITSAEKYREF